MGEAQRRYREKNREKCRAAARAWYHKTKDARRAAVAEKGKLYREANREKLIERRKAAYAASRDAQIEKARLWREANPEKVRESARRYYHANADRMREKNRVYQKTQRVRILKKERARRYGLDEAALDAMLEQQGGKCAICGNDTRLEVDHCHDTGRVRGLLCGGCNRGIGMFGDAPARMRAAADYIERHQQGA